MADNDPKTDAPKAPAKEAKAPKAPKARKEVTHRADTNPRVEPEIAVAPVTSEAADGTVEAVDGRRVKGVVRDDGEVREAAPESPKPAGEKFSTGRADAR